MDSDGNENITCGKIPSDLEELYRYKIRDSLDEITVELIIPEYFDPSFIQVSLSKKRTSISVCSSSIKNIPPFFEGLLWGKVKSVDSKIVGDEFIISMPKEKCGLWSIPIKDNNSQTGRIDPQSLFNIGMYNIDKNKTKIKESAMYGYTPALVYLGFIYLMSNSSAMQDLGESYCLEAIDSYDCEEAMAFYGEYLLKNKPRKATYAISLLEKAAGRGVTMAHAYLGRALSPLSSVLTVKKDAKRALDELKQAKDVPLALHEIAMMYYNGVCVQQNDNIAVFFQNKAERIAIVQNSYVEPLKRKKKIFDFKMFLIGIVAMVIILLVINYYFKRGKRKVVTKKNSRSFAYD